MYRPIQPLIVLGASLLTACATIPEPLRGDFAAIDPGQAAPVEQRVRWGGRIVDVLPGPERTCLEVLGMPLDSSARPFDLDADIGRFRACRPGFLDPAVFVSGREITVTGAVEAEVERQIGEYTYRMPQVQVDTLFLWPERPEYDYIYLHSDGFFGYYPWWPAAPMVIHPRPRKP
jgi:outer membrane lipoprotein